MNSMKRIKPVKSGRGIRMSYAKQREVLEMPNLIEVQKNSYQWFLDTGLKEVFDDISPIADYSGHLSLEFTDFTLCKDDVKYSIDECKERDATYAAPLKVRVRLINKETDEINEHEIFMGVRSFIPAQLFRTVAPGWNMKRIPMTYSVFVLTVPVKYR